nr:hypothetical protein [Dyadobacter fermentans]
MNLVSPSGGHAYEGGTLRAGHTRVANALGLRLSLFVYRIAFESKREK